jgi:putative peptidoglycan lipid II flippase
MFSKLNTFWASVVVSVSSILTGTLGFLNQLVLAKLFGTTIEMDAYLVAMAVPGILMGLSQPLFIHTIVPTLGKYNQNEKKRKKLITTFFLLTSLLSLFIIISGIFISPTLLHILIPNYPPLIFKKVVEISRASWIIAGCFLLSSFFISIYYSLKKFLVPSAVSLLPPLLMIISAILLANKIGIKSVVVGLLVATILQLIFLTPEVMQQLVCFKSVYLKDSEVSGVLKRLLPNMFAYLPFSTPQIIEAFWAAKLEHGSISYLGYCQRIVTFLSVAIGYSLANVSFPELVEYGARGDIVRVKAIGAHRLRFILLISVLISTVIIVLRIPLLQIGLQRGAFNELSTYGVASVLPWYLLSMIAISAINFIYRIYYATRDFKTPAIVGLIIPVIYFGLSGLLIRYWSYIGIGVAFVCSWWFFFLVLTLLLDKERIYFWNNDFIWFLFRLSVSAFFSGVISSLVLSFVFNILGLWKSTLLIFVINLFSFFILTNYIFCISEIKTLTRRLYIKKYI